MTREPDAPQLSASRAKAEALAKQPKASASSVANRERMTCPESRSGDRYRDTTRHTKRKRQGDVTHMSTALDDRNAIPVTDQPIRLKLLMLYRVENLASSLSDLGDRSEASGPC